MKPNEVPQSASQLELTEPTLTTHGILKQYEIDESLQKQLIDEVNDQRYKRIELRARLALKLLNTHEDQLATAHDLPDVARLRVLLSAPPDVYFETIPIEEQLADLLEHTGIILKDDAVITDKNLLGILIRSRMYAIQLELLRFDFHEKMGTLQEGDEEERERIRDRLEVTGSWYAAISNEDSALPQEQIANEKLQEYYRKKLGTIQAKQHTPVQKERQVQRPLNAALREQRSTREESGLKDIPEIKD